MVTVKFNLGSEESTGVHTDQLGWVCVRMQDCLPKKEMQSAGCHAVSLKVIQS